MSLQFRSTTQREPNTQSATAITTSQNESTRPQSHHRGPSGKVPSPPQHSSQGGQDAMAYPTRDDNTRGRAPRDNNPPAPATDTTRSWTLRPQRRSFDNISNLSNQPDVGSGSDIGGRGRAPILTATEAATTRPSAMRRPAVFYPGPSLAPSHETQQRSQSQGLWTEDLLDHRHRSTRNPDSDSEYSSSELSTSTQATTVASDDESLNRSKQYGSNGNASYRPSAAHLRQAVPMEAPVPCRRPRESSQRLFTPRGSTVQSSARESSVQFSAPLESSFHLPTGSSDPLVPYPHQRDAQGQPARGPKVALAAPQPPRPDRQSDATRKHMNPVNSVSPEIRQQQHQPIPGSFPVSAEPRRPRAEDVFRNKIGHLKEENDTLHRQQSRSSKVLEATLLRPASFQVAKEAAERIRDQEKELREGLSHDLDEQERTIEQLEHTVNETARQLANTTKQLADAHRQVEEKDGLVRELDELKAIFTEASQILIDVQTERDGLKKTLEDTEYRAGRQEKEASQQGEETNAREVYFVARLAGLELAKETLEIRVETLGTEKATMEMQYSDVVKDNGMLMAEGETLSEKVKLLALEKRAVEEANAVLKTTMGGLEDVKKGLRSRIEGIEVDKEELKRQVSALGKEKTDLNARIDSLETDKNELQNLGDALDADQSDLDSKIETLKGEKKDAESRVDALDTEVAKLMFDLEAATGEKDKLHTQVEALTGGKKDLETRLEGFGMEIGKLKGEVEAKEAVKGGLETQLEHIAAAKEKLEAQVKHLQTTMEESNSKFDTLNMEKAAQVTLSGALTVERDSLKEEVDSLRSKTTEQESEISTLIESTATIQSELDSLQQTAAGLASENEQIKAAQAALPADVWELQKAVTEHQATNASLSEEAAKVAPLTAEKSELEARLAEATAIASQLAGLLEENTNLVTQLTIANAQIAELGHQLGAAGQRIEQTKAAYQTSAAEVAKLTEAVGHLRTRIAELRPARKKGAVKMKQDQLVLVRSAGDKGTLQVVKKNDLRPSRSPSATRSE